MKYRHFILIASATLLTCSSAEQKWPFDQPKNVAVITLKQIVVDKAPILRVTHDAEDHGWQFLNPSFEASSSNAYVVGLGQIVKLDPSVLEVADLPPGWVASRESVGGKWVKEKLPVESKK